MRHSPSKKPAAAAAAAARRVLRFCLRPRNLSFIVVLYVICLSFFLWLAFNLHIVHSSWFPPQLEVTRHSIPINGLSPELSHAKIAVLSDIHFSLLYTHISQSFLDYVIKTINELNPDVVLVVGDLIDGDPSSGPAIGQALAQIKPSVSGGCLVVLGNHDSHEIVLPLRALGLEVLLNDIAYPLGKGLAFVGLGDVAMGDFEPESILESLPSSLPRIVMSHHPDTANVLRKWRIDLQVSGHTHATQIKLPLIGAVLPLLHHIKTYLLPRWLHEMIPLFRHTDVLEDWELVYGLHSLPRDIGDSGAEGDPNNRVLITAGVGITPPFRLALPSEVVLLTLLPSADN